MLDLEDPKDKQKIEEVWDKRKFKNIIYYLVKQTRQLFEYNLYKLATHLANTSKAIATFEQKLKQKKTQKKDYKNKSLTKQACYTI